MMGSDVSDPSVTLIGMYHPWRHLRSLGDWDLVWGDLPIGVRGITDHPCRTVELDRVMAQAERRCTIAHEIVHIERGPMPTDPYLAALEEAAVQREAARRLIPLPRLLAAIRWSRDLHEVADELWVDVDTLAIRMRYLHPAERAEVDRLHDELG